MRQRTNNFLEQIKRAREAKAVPEPAATPEATPEPEWEPETPEVAAAKLLSPPVVVGRGGRVIPIG